MKILFFFLRNEIQSADGNSASKLLDDDLCCVKSFSRHHKLFIPKNFENNFLLHQNQNEKLQNKFFSGDDRKVFTTLMEACGFFHADINLFSNCNVETMYFLIQRSAQQCWRICEIINTFLLWTFHGRKFMNVGRFSTAVRRVKQNEDSIDVTKLEILSIFVCQSSLTRFWFHRFLNFWSRYQ